MGVQVGGEAVNDETDSPGAKPEEAGVNVAGTEAP